MRGAGLRYEEPEIPSGDLGGEEAEETHDGNDAGEDKGRTFFETIGYLTCYKIQITKKSYHILILQIPFNNKPS